MRRCSRTACAAEAVATLTFDYGDSMAVLGPLALSPEPHGYLARGQLDQPPHHAERTSAPVGWQVVRHVSLGEVGFKA